MTVHGIAELSIPITSTTWRDSRWAAALAMKIPPVESWMKEFMEVAENVVPDPSMTRAWNMPSTAAIFNVRRPSFSRTLDRTMPWAWTRRYE